MRDVITAQQIERFWSQVEPFIAGDACWIWTGRTHHGRGKYGEFCWSFDGVSRYVGAHRVSYALLVADPGELTIDHLCRNTLCVNPDHLEPVTVGENVRRGFPGRRRMYNANGFPVCAHGHEISGHNAMPDKRRTNPVCRTCAYEGVRRFKERRNAA